MDIVSTGSSVEDAVNQLIAQGIARGHILGEVLRIARWLLGNPGIALIDELDDGNLTGIIFGNPLLIEHVAELCKSEDWIITDMPADKKDSLAYSTMQ